MNKKIFAVVSFLLLILSGVGCRKSYTPLPRGYYRIDFPEKSYLPYEADCPYRFEYPAYAKVLPDESQNAGPYWINIEFPDVNGTVYISYKMINGNLNKYIEDSRSLVYKHVIKAEEIPETPIVNKEENIYGIFYDIKGNTASSVQFFLTDSTRHFLRGSLYFRTQPDKDSLAPVINFVREDILHLINTFQWK